MAITATIIRAKRITATQVELSEPLPDDAGEIEVIFRPAANAALQHNDDLPLLEWLQTLPPGTRSKQDIDAQIGQLRGEWDGR